MDDFFIVINIFFNRAAAKHHLRPIKTPIQKAYVTVRLSNVMIVSNEITGSEKLVLVFVLETGDQSNIQHDHGPLPKWMHATVLLFLV